MTSDLDGLLSDALSELTTDTAKKAIIPNGTIKEEQKANVFALQHWFHASFLSMLRRLIHIPKVNWKLLRMRSQNLLRQF